MFLKERCRRGIEMDTMVPAGWQLEIVPHSKQVDSTSCGIHVIRVKYSTEFNFHQPIKPMYIISCAPVMMVCAVKCVQENCFIC